MLVSDIYTPFGYTARIMANYGVLLFFSGIVGTIIFGIVIDKTQMLKKALILSCLGTAASLIVIICVV